MIQRWQIKNWAVAHWIPLAIGGVFFALLIYFFFSGWVGGQVERFNQWRFDKAVAAKEAEIQTLKSENAKLLEDVKREFALGQAKELERDAAYAELARYGAAAKAAVEAQKKAAEEYESDKNAIAVDVPLHQRCERLCAERTELGYGCKPDAVSYCARYR